MNRKKIFILLSVVILMVIVLPNFSPIYSMGNNNELVLPDEKQDTQDIGMIETSDGEGDFATFFNETIMMPPAIAWEATLWRVAIASLFGIFIAFLNFLTYTGTKYERSSVHAQILITITSSLIINVIGNNIAWALGLFGALSFVRFRTTLRDTKDTAVFFYSVATGIACGLGYFGVAAIGAIVVTPMLFILKYIPAFNFHYIDVTFRCSNVDETIKVLEQYFKSHKLRAKMTSVAIWKINDAWEIGYKIFIHKNKAIMLAEDIRRENINLITNYKAETV